MPTKIEWSEETWNPIRARNTETGKVGWHCVHVSEGCRNCYAEKMNGWRGTGAFYLKNAMDSEKIELFLDEKALLKPLRKKKPTTYFPCSMTDMYADFVPDSWLDKIVAVEALTPQHTYQHLTKRPERMAEYLGKAGISVFNPLGQAISALSETLAPVPRFYEWPLPKVWLGVSVEDQATADERIPHLLNTPAAVRFVSFEPALGPVDFTDLGGTDDAHGISALWDTTLRPRLDWIICGGESGPNARPMHTDWARAVRDQCAAAGVSYFFKQWGEHLPVSHAPGKEIMDITNHDPDRQWFAKVGKKLAGRLLDGVEHNGMPERSG